MIRLLTYFWWNHAWPAVIGAHYGLMAGMAVWPPHIH